MSTSSIARQRPRSYDGRSATELAVFAATEKLLQETFLRELTVAQILSHARISRANFYHYFASKYDVVVAMLARLLEEAYAGDGPWNGRLGKTRKWAMETDLRQAIALWTEHGALMCGVIEHMHAVPQLAAAWNLVLDRFVSSIAEQIDDERSLGKAPSGLPAALIATAIMCAYERSFYVGYRGLDDQISSPDAAVSSIISSSLAAVYGDRRVKRHLRRTKPRRGSARSAATHPAVDIREIGLPWRVREFPGGAPETVAAILEAVNSLLEDSSLDELTVADILTRAGKSRATFYFYFQNKYDAFVALFQRTAAVLVADFAKIATIDRSDPDRVRARIIDWLDLDSATVRILRNAVNDWPRRPELRTTYLGAMATMADLFATLIEADRADGSAIEGPEASRLSAVLLWTIERCMAGSLAGEANLEDTEKVSAFLGDLVVATVYGSGQGTVAANAVASESSSKPPAADGENAATFGARRTGTAI